jgi:hypothetical protein
MFTIAYAQTRRRRCSLETVYLITHAAPLCTLERSGLAGPRGGNDREGGEPKEVFSESEVLIRVICRRKEAQ